MKKSSPLIRHGHKNCVESGVSVNDGASATRDDTRLPSFLSALHSSTHTPKRNSMKWWLTLRNIAALMIIGGYFMFVFNCIASSFTGIYNSPETQDHDEGQGQGQESVDGSVVHMINMNMPINDADDDEVARSSPALSPSLSMPNQSLSFTSQTGQTFQAASPHHKSFVAINAGHGNFTGDVYYLRKQGDLEERGVEGGCARTLDVLAWLMDRINERGSRLMIAYGGLIHIHREKEFVYNTTGEYIDDDIDMWAAPEAVAHVGQLEEQLFSQFGWSMRVFATGEENFVVLMQVFASSGHEYYPYATKAWASEPAIEIYPIVAMDTIPREMQANKNNSEADEDDESRVFKDLWQGTTLAESLVHPTKHVDFKSVGTNQTLHLQLPNEELEIMECLYDNWRVPSREHAGDKKHCDSSG